MLAGVICEGEGEGMGGEERNGVLLGIALEMCGSNSVMSCQQQTWRTTASTGGLGCFGIAERSTNRSWALTSSKSKKG